MLGPSGCGKTTLLRVIAGLEPQVDIYKQVVGQQNFGMGATVSIILLAPTLLAFIADRVVQKRSHAALTARSVPWVPAPAPIRDALFTFFCSLIALLILAMLFTAGLGSLINIWPYALSHPDVYPERWTLAHYTFREVGGGGFRAFWTTMRMAAYTALFGTLITFVSAWLIEKTRGAERLRQGAYLLSIVPLALPGMVIGIAYVFFFNKPTLGLPFTNWHIPNPFLFMYGTMAILVLSNIIHFYTVSFLTATTALRQLVHIILHSLFIIHSHGKKQMNPPKSLPENPYLLLTPGPLSTTSSVKATMLRDWCTWDQEYHDLVQHIRHRLVDLAGSVSDLTAVLMQGSGTFCVEAAIGTMMPADGKLLVLANGAYGLRMARIAQMLKIPCQVEDSGETSPPDENHLKQILARDGAITHVALVHCETTTGMLNPLETIGPLVKAAGRLLVVDAMSSFGGIPMNWEACGIDVLISSANKCIQGVPGFGFILVRRQLIQQWAGQARSLSLDVYDQWQTMEEQAGKWRFTSPTHVVRAFAQALKELDQEGGIPARFKRYSTNQRLLVSGMQYLGFQPLLSLALQSPIITAFINPPEAEVSFDRLYKSLRARGFVIYPGKVSVADCFRIGTIGEVYPQQIQSLLEAVADIRQVRRVPG